MDPSDSGQGQGVPSEQHCYLLPSSKGRQRKKNQKYLDYETKYVCDGKSEPGRQGAASKETPVKRGKAKNAAQQTAEESNGKTSEETPKKAVGGKKTPAKKTPAKKTPAKNAAKQTAEESNGKTSEETPKKAVSDKKTPAKKTPVKKTPAKKAPAKVTPAADGGLPTGEGGVIDTVQQENGTPKPKRKYVRKQPAQKVEPVAEPLCKAAPTEPEEETQPGGRRRRGAAKAALRYFHILAKEVLSHPSDDESGSQPGANSDITHSEPDPVTERASLKGSNGRQGLKRKRSDYDRDLAGDEDFVPDVEEVDDDKVAEDTDSNSDVESGGGSPAAFHVNRTYSGPCSKTPNGFNTNIMRTVWESTETTKKFREEHYSSWVFPEWVPSTSDWHPVPHSDFEKYLPQELQSAAFKVCREGLSMEETPLQRLSRFTAVPAHPDRWDMVLYAGGPVWAMEWCPTPGGVPASQYIALACHRGMDDRHYVNKTYTGHGLVQLWDVGKLEYNLRPDSQPALAYGLAQDKGFIWELKWCPAGGWEPPSCGRKTPLLPRLGLLAVAGSSSVVTIYSLPHPDALNSNKTLADSGNSIQQLPIYQAEGVLTLKLGSFKAPRHEKSGQVLCMDWLPEKPHNIMAIGFYDGIVGLWDLSTKSPLLRVRESDESLSLLPYRCLLAHDQAVRALAFCPASRHLLVTAGEDRYVKTWDLRRLYDPITVMKRFLTNEIYWPLNAPGLLLAQESAYTASGSHGVHYFDHNARAFFAIPRTGTLWSISYTDWLNSVVTSDCLGEVIFALLPQMCYTYPYVKRTIERRFPIYFTSLVPYDATNEENQEKGRVEEEEGDATEEQEGGDTEGANAASEGGNENDTESGRDGRRRRKDKNHPVCSQTYKEAVKKYCIQHTDGDMRTFARIEQRAMWKRMKATELNTTLNVDEMPLAALHKVRFNPNMCCHTWVVTGGQTGLVRLNCLRSMISSQAKKIMRENQAQFNSLYSPQDNKEAVQTVMDEL